MYSPKHFEITDEEEIFSFVEANAFGQLISNVGGRLISTHLPFLVSDDRSKLICHLARQNDQWQGIDHQEVLVTLQGPHDYISPSWYLAPGVPTWNYQSVHLYGICSAFHESDRLKAIVDGLTEKYESSLERPWKADYKASILKGIVGLEIEITGIQCKYKLSQNRSTQDQAQVVKQLKLRGSDQLAKAMKDAG